MEKDNIYQKLNKLKESVLDGFNKDKKGYNYSYVTVSQIFTKINPMMVKLGIVVIPDVNCQDIKTSWYTYITKKGEQTDAVVESYVSFKWLNIDDKDDFFIVNMPLIGQQGDISQAYGTALTYAERYMYLKVLGVQTDADDPDIKNYNSSTTKTTIKKGLSDKQIGRLWAIAKAKGVTEENVKRALQKLYQVEDVKDLSVDDYNELCSRIEDKK